MSAYEWVSNDFSIALRLFQETCVSQQTEKAFICIVVVNIFKYAWVKGAKWSFEQQAKRQHHHNAPCCDGALWWKARRRATGEDFAHHSTTEPQPLTPQHALKHHTNYLLLLDQLHTNHTACNDWTVEVENFYRINQWCGHIARRQSHCGRMEKTTAGGDTHALHTGEHTTSCSMQICSPLSGELSPVSLCHTAKTWWWWTAMNGYVHVRLIVFGLYIFVNYSLCLFWIFKKEMYSILESSVWAEHLIHREPGAEWT